MRDLSDAYREPHAICPACRKPVWQGSVDTRCICSGADLRSRIATLEAERDAALADRALLLDRGVASSRGGVAMTPNTEHHDTEADGQAEAPEFYGEQLTLFDVEQYQPSPLPGHPDRGGRQ